MQLKRAAPIAAIIVVAIVLSIFLYLRFRKSTDFEPLIKEKLVTLVSKATNGLYILSISNIEVDVLSSTVTASGISMLPDSARMAELDSARLLPDDIFKLTVDGLTITGLSPTDFIDKDNISATQLLLNAPNVHITHKKRNYNEPATDTSNLYERIAGNNKSYALQNLLLKDAHITHSNLDGKKQETVFEHVTVSMDDILVSAAAAADSSRFLFAKDATISLKNYKTVSPDKRYNISIDSLLVKPGKRSLLASNIKYSPRLSKEQFGKAAGMMKERYDVHFKQITATNIDWWTLLANDGMQAEQVSIDGGSIQVYLDRRLPPPTETKMGKYPHQLVKKIDMPVNLRQLKVTGLLVKYEEVNPKSGQAGIVSFHNCTGLVKNITNDAAAIEKDPLMKAHAEASFMNEGALKADFTFNLARAATGDFKVTAELGPMNGTQLNRATEALAMVKIEEMQLDKMEATVTGNDKVGNGNIRFTYHDLKISALKKDDEGDLKKKGLLSFIANSFVVKRDGETPAKTYETQYERDPYRSFFNTVWQPVSMGILKAVKGK